MKTKEKHFGAIEATFKELVRKGNKLGLIGKDGDRLMFRMTGEGVEQEIPYSVVWKFKDVKFKAVCGALGVPIEKIKRVYDESGIEVALEKFEKIAKAKQCKTAVYMFNDFGSGMRPWEGEFDVVFSRFVNRDKNTGKPVWENKHETRKGREGKDYEYDKNEFKIEYRVVGGDNENATFTRTEHYCIVKDEEDEWMFDGAGQGAGFKTLLDLHSISTEKMEPDSDFEDPENGLPEIEQMLQKRNAKSLIVMRVTVSDGRIMKLEKSSGVPVTGKVDEGEEYAAQNIAKLFARIDELCRDATKKSAWDSTGKLSENGKMWAKDNLLPLMKKKDMPKSFKQLNDKQVAFLLKKLGDEDEDEE